MLTLTIDLILDKWHPMPESMDAQLLFIPLAYSLNNPHFEVIFGLTVDADRPEAHSYDVMSEILTSQEQDEVRIALSAIHRRAFGNDDDFDEAIASAREKIHKEVLFRFCVRMFGPTVAEKMWNKIPQDLVATKKPSRGADFPEVYVYALHLPCELFGELIQPDGSTRNVTEHELRTFLIHSEYDGLFNPIFNYFLGL